MNPAVVKALLAAARSRRGRKVIAWTAAGLAALTAVTVMAAVAVVTTLFNAGQVQLLNPSQYCVSAAAPQRPLGQWTGRQMAIAAIIVRTGQASHVPVYGRVIAVATAMQESSLTNLRHGDRDSVGTFQQRPSQGWGPARKLLDPAYAARKFYQRLLRVPGWRHLPLTVAAWDVQHSGTPAAYAQWQAEATAVVGHVTGQVTGQITLTAAGGAGGGGCVTTAGLHTGGAEAAAIVHTVIGYARGQVGKPYQWGGTGPDAFDCSGLVMMAYHAAGIGIPRTSQQQWTWGPRIRPGTEQPGDLVFFAGSDGTMTAPGHVGIVIGRGLMIEAYTTGVPIRVATYHRPGLVGFTRPWAHAGTGAGTGTGTRRLAAGGQR